MISALPEERDVPSPCINVCKMSPGSGLCEGCLRTLDEIAAWSTMSPEEKRAVLAQLAGRKRAP
jgi:predicted Fe-S protein YdhL (DUF1289 family)